MAGPLFLHSSFGSRKRTCFIRTVVVDTWIRADGCSAAENISVCINHSSPSPSFILLVFGGSVTGWKLAAIIDVWDQNGRLYLHSHYLPMSTNYWLRRTRRLYWSTELHVSSQIHRQFGISNLWQNKHDWLSEHFFSASVWLMCFLYLSFDD